MPAASDHWPDLPYAAWKDTCQTLHLWTQIGGKIRLARTPWLSHGWLVTWSVTTNGLTTSPLPVAVTRRNRQGDLYTLEKKPL